MEPLFRCSAAKTRCREPSFMGKHARKAAESRLPTPSCLLESRCRVRSAAPRLLPQLACSCANSISIFHKSKGVKQDLLKQDFLKLSKSPENLVRGKSTNRVSGGKQLTCYVFPLRHCKRSWSIPALMPECQKAVVESPFRSCSAADDQQCRAERLAEPGSTFTSSNAEHGRGAAGASLLPKEVPLAVFGVHQSGGPGNDGKSESSGRSRSAES